MNAPTCQEVTPRTIVGDEHVSIAASCGKPVAGIYRQCARGCQRSIAYCEEHGGDRRALDEVVRHMDQEHRAC